MLASSRRSYQSDQLVPISRSNWIRLAGSRIQYQVVGKTVTLHLCRDRLLCPYRSGTPLFNVNRFLLERYLRPDVSGFASECFIWTQIFDPGS